MWRNTTVYFVLYANHILLRVVFGVILCLCLIGTFTEVLQDAFTPSTEFIPKETNMEESNEVNLNHNPGLEREHLISSIKMKRGKIILYRWV